MAYQRYDDDLAYGDDYGGGGRWDRSRFERERARSRSRGPVSRYGYEEDRYRGPPSAGFRERDTRVFVEEDRYERPRRPRPEFLDEDRYRVQGREMAMYRDSGYERSPRTPQYIRRRSSYDEYERGGTRRRYEDEDDHVRVKININDSPPPTPRRYDDRYRPPAPEPRYYQDEFRYSRDRDYDDWEPSPRIVREREIRRTVPSWRDERESSTFEEVIEDRTSTTHAQRHKRGRTRMPKRLVHKRAIQDMNLPYDEEEDFFVVRVALQKEDIDEVVRLSEQYKETDRTTSFSFQETKQETKAIEAPPASDENEETEFTETVTTRVIENPTDDEIARYSAKATGEDANGNDNGNGGGEQVDEHQSEHLSVHESTHESMRSGRSGHSRRAKSNAGTEKRETTSEYKRTSTKSAVEESSSSSSDTEVRDYETTTRSLRRSRSSHAVPARSDRRKSHQSHRSRSRPRRSSRYYEDDEYDVEEVEIDDRRGDSGSIGGPLTLLATDRSRRRSRDLKFEIAQLEAEKRRIRRRSDVHHGAGEYEVVERRRSHGGRKASADDGELELRVSRGDKEREAEKTRARSRARSRTNQRIIEAAMATLT